MDDDRMFDPADGAGDPDGLARTIGAGQAVGEDSAPGIIGAYRILGQLGEGGMGVVYEAEQQSPRRRVALKVIRGGGFVDELQVRMFQREAETLARLDHPDIAAIYEAGRTAEGRHYFAMELVRGETLDVFLARRPAVLTARELHFRLSLFARICRAVHYAHQRGVIHRDLKPSNIVVAAGEDPAATAIKILDFGLARITDSDLAAASLVTEIGKIKGTLQYMSPEQAQGDPAAIDLRSDVYSLGVILYQMLAGRRPYETGQLSLIRAVQVICQEPPSSLRDGWPGPARLDQDLETIVGKTLDKAPDGRYGSAAALADDVERHLTSQPILARPPSAMYQLRKLVARRKGPFAAVVAGLVLIVAFGFGMSVLYLRAEVNLRRAVAAEAEAEANFVLAREAVDEYLTQVAESSELRAVGLEELRRRLLDTARRFYERFTATEPGSQPMQDELGVAWERLGRISRVVGDLAAAEAAFASAGEIFAGASAAPAADPAATARLAAAVGNLALVQYDLGSLEPAARNFQRAIELEAALVAAEPDHDGWRGQQARTLDHYAQLLERERRLEEAERHYLQALAIRGGLAADYPQALHHRFDLVQGHVNVGVFYARERRLEEAAAQLRSSLPVGEALVADAPGDPEYRNALAAAIGNLAGVLMLQDAFTETEDLYRRELEVRERLVVDHPSVLNFRLQIGSTYTNLGELEARRGRPEHALPWLEQAIGVLDWVLEREPRHATARFFQSYTLAMQARAFGDLGRPAVAIAAWERAIELDDRDDAELRSGLAAARAAAGGR